jgi:hypothetical protein
MGSMESVHIDHGYTLVQIAAIVAMAFGVDAGRAGWRDREIRMRLRCSSQRSGHRVESRVALLIPLDRRH